MNLTMSDFWAWLRGARQTKEIENVTESSISVDQIVDKWIEDASMKRKHDEVVSGGFLYYIVEEGTNIRRSQDGVPITYSDVDIADYNCNWAREQTISVAAYNRIFGGMNNGNE